MIYEIIYILLFIILRMIMKGKRLATMLVVLFQVAMGVSAVFSRLKKWNQMNLSKHRIKPAHILWILFI